MKPTLVSLEFCLFVSLLVLWRQLTLQTLSTSLGTLFFAIHSILSFPLKAPYQS
ncbi:hypothetical protein HMPREF1402_00612 [Helicobacter pylori GAM121Aii]|nr:hypothetical protein HMPREF1402_00612 [Helicobacter pylori GAM121Aii]